MSMRRWTGGSNLPEKPRCLQDYQGRISGPFMDRIDLFFDTPPVTAADLALPAPHEGTKEVAERVKAAWHIQKTRTQDHGGKLNANLSTAEIDMYCLPDADGAALLTKAATQFSLSARAYHRVLKLSRTLADLEASRSVRRHHVAEALTYRWRDPAAGLTPPSDKSAIVGA